MAFSIEYYMVITVAGRLGPPIFTIGYELVPKNEVDVYCITEIEIETSDTEYIVFSQSTVPDNAFCKWFVEIYMVNFLNNNQLSNFDKTV